MSRVELDRVENYLSERLWMEVVDNTCQMSAGVSCYDLLPIRQLRTEWRSGEDAHFTAECILLRSGYQYDPTTSLWLS